MVAGHVSDISVDSHLIEAGIRSSLMTFAKMLPKNRMVLKSQDFIDSSGAARSCLQQLQCDGVAVTLSLTGRLSGTLDLVLDTRGAQQLVAALMGAGATTSLFDEMACSVLKEAGNIVASAFLGAIEALCGRGGLPGVPVLHIGGRCREEEESRLLYALPLNLVAPTDGGQAARGGIFISLHSNDSALISAD